MCNLQFERYVSPCRDFSVTLSRPSRPSAPRRGGGRPLRGVAQLASASGLGPEGRVFESHHPDERKEADSTESWPLFSCRGRWCEGKVVRRLRAAFSGSHWVGNGLDGELAQLVPLAGLTSAQTNAVIPPGTPISSRSRSLKAELRRRTTFPSYTPPSGVHVSYGQRNRTPRLISCTSLQEKGH